ncbi:uncharacterized protein LOC118280974 [Spodoptera frugiperda]|uniref:RNA-directed DNA polymerase n=1 Tax=Spodoptera frugiperda TaxID=7108 RepID=A0A9R0DK38_SPOFR|nr:uncharacterized protein LOC118280974 [Spodoptera frugiperda]
MFPSSPCGDEGNITLTEEEIVAERGHADVAASAGSRPTEPAPHFTQEFLSTLIETITRAQVEANRSLVNTLMGSGGDFRASTPVGPPPFSNATGGGTAVAAPPCSEANFVKCTARFDGTSPDAEVLEAFLDAVEIYKECAAVSDEHALRGLPMLLEGEAAVWWRGVKASVTTWADATARLRATYGVAQPAHLILREIFAREQQEERAESFICRVRALIARLPYTLDQTLQTDICYGLLHRRVVKRVPRDSVRGLDDLLHKARIAEDTYKASKVNSDNVSSKNSIKTSVSSTTDCILTQSGSATTGATSSRCNNRSRPRCSFCKLFGHVSDECRNREKAYSKNNNNTTPREVRCYGCGKQGVVRSKCDVCVNTTSKSDDKISFNKLDVDFCKNNVDVSNNSRSYTSRVDTNSCVSITSAYLGSRDDHPMINISVAGRRGVAVVDTGATHSIASPLLHRILVNSGVRFTETRRFVRLADGTQGWRDLLSAETEVIIAGRRIMCKFLVLPGRNVRTLLGVDFLTRAGMVIDVARRTWSFTDSPERRFDLVCTYTLGSSNSADASLLHAASADDLAPRPREGKFTPMRRRTPNAFIKDRAPRAARDVPASKGAAPQAARRRNKVSSRLKGGIKVDADKTADVANLAAPQNVKQLEWFLHTSCRYRRFIGNYAGIARPLTDLLKKSSAWQWGTEQQEAYERIKSLIVSAPILRQADASKPFILSTDSSAYCLGAVLMQGEGHDEQPIEYASRLLTTTERNYSTTERETLAVVWALGKFRGYVETAKVTVRTDYQPLGWLMGQRSPSGRLARWAPMLREFDLSIEYTPRRSQVVAGTISRPVSAGDQDECDLSMISIDMPERSSRVRSSQPMDPRGAYEYRGHGVRRTL